MIHDLLGEYSRSTLVDYWEGRLDPEESAAIDAEMDHDPELRERMAYIVEDLRQELEQIRAKILREGADDHGAGRS